MDGKYRMHVAWYAASLCRIVGCNDADAATQPLDRSAITAHGSQQGLGCSGHKLVITNLLIVMTYML